MELNATAKVILGVLAARPRSGYEIKQLVDNSARFFWAASYGQIYPELKRLAEAGLVTGADTPRGGRRRTVYELTAEGKRVAREWVESPPGPVETRDEGLLKLFFAGSVEPRRAAEIARERAASAAELADQLAALERMLAAEPPAAAPPHSTDAGSLEVLRYGIELNEWIADWFERAATRLEGNPAETRRKGGR